MSSIWKVACCLVRRSVARRWLRSGGDIGESLVARSVIMSLGWWWSEEQEMASLYRGVRR